MKPKKLFNALAASSLGLSCIGTPQSTNAQMAACPNPSTLANVAGFVAATGGACAGTPDEYGVTVYKMGLCTSDPTPAPSVAADYSSCSLTFEDSAGSVANFAAGRSLGLPASSTTRPANGTYGYAIILIGTTFNIKAQYGPVGATTYYSTATSTGWPAVANTTGPATLSPVPLGSFNPGTSCDSQDSLSIPSGTLTGTTLNSSQQRIPDSSAVTTCSGATYILGVVSLSAPVTIDESVTALDALFTVTNMGTTITTDNAGGLIFDSGPFNVVLSVVRGS
jgi:hypothetical protein